MLSSPFVDIVYAHWAVARVQKSQQVWRSQITAIIATSPVPNRLKGTNTTAIALSTAFGLSLLALAAALTVHFIRRRSSPSKVNIAPASRVPSLRTCQCRHGRVFGRYVVIICLSIRCVRIDCHIHILLSSHRR